MVMPPFPPPPYVESPAYIMPHPHIQPIDYRRLLHPQVHAPSAPYQNPYHTRRVRPSHTVPVRETVNSAVQTEPTQQRVGGYADGSPPIRSDSGHGTASNSPSSSSSSSQKQGSANVENYTLTSNKAKDLQTNGTCTNGTGKHGFNILTSRPTEIKCRTDSVGKENVPPSRNAHCNMWSVGSPDSMVPVCSSSQQEDEVVKERRVSFPDILMSWGGGTPQATMQKMANEVLHQNDEQLPCYENEVEHEKSVCRSPTEPKNGPVVADSNNDAENMLSSKELLSESRRKNESVGLVSSLRQSLPYRDELLPSLNKSHTLPDHEQDKGETNLSEDPTEIILYQMLLNSCQMKRKLNDSVWSVESLGPFIPNKELLLQKNNFESEMIIEMTEEDEISRLTTLNDNLIVKSRQERRQSRSFSSSDSVPMSDSWLVFSTPAEKPISLSKKPEMESETDASEVRGPKKGHIMAPAEKNPLVSLTPPPCDTILSTPTEEEVDENRSSEPEANQSPNQETVIENEQQGKSTCSPQQKDSLFLSSAAGEKISSMGQLILQNGVNMEVEGGPSGNEEASWLRNEQLCVPMSDQRMAEVSPSKGHLVDCGIQCSNLLPCSNNCMEGPSRRHPIKYSGDMLLLFNDFIWIFYYIQYTVPQ